MSAGSPLDPLVERVERLLVRYEELQRTNALLAEQVELLTLRLAATSISRQISTASDTVAHDGGDLNNALTAHDRVVPEDAPEMFLIRKNLILKRKVNARRIHQVDNRQPVLHGDFLGTQILLGSHREPCTGLYGRVIGYDHALTPRNITDPGHDSG